MEFFLINGFRYETISVFAKAFTLKTVQLLNVINILYVSLLENLELTVYASSEIYSLWITTVSSTE